MAGIVNYEVYVFHSSTWNLLNRYPGEKRAEAIEYAKSVEKNEHRPTKVIRETYDLSSQTFHEALVYMSEIPKQQKKTSPYANSTIPSITDEYKTKKSNTNIVESITKLLLTTVFSIVIAAIITVTLIHLGASSNLLPDHLTQQFVLGIFTFFFLIISIPVASKWVDWDAFIPPAHPQRRNEEASISTPDYKIDFSNKALYEIGQKKEEKEPSSFLSRIIRNIFDVFDLLMGRDPLSRRKQEKEEENSDENAPSDEEEQTLQETEENTEEDVSADIDEQKNTEEEQKIEETIKPEDLNDSSQDDKIVIPPELEESYLKITAFLSIVLRGLQNQKTVLNSFARFGLELFLAGACEQICEKDKLTKEQNQLLLSSLLMLLGRTKTLADIFYYKMDEYTLEPKYLPMIKNGEEGMRIYCDNPSSPEIISFTLNAMENWLNPNKKDQPASGICTIMFTDMVSSTQMTQTLGDQLAQQLIHTHNIIVRKALKASGGTEIKQTGDGIMASFMWASNAVDAAIAIQKAVLKYNQESPTVPLEVRIGLNSGEPIIEDNDLFGATVQLASRICGQASAEQIYVSSVVKELSAGKKYSFKSLGSLPLKGIDEPQPLFEVLWKKTDESEGVKNVRLSETLSEF